MLTNTAAVQPTAAISAVDVAIEDCERRHRRALEEVGDLRDQGAIGAAQAAALEADTIARFVAQARELEQRGAQICGPVRWGRYEQLARERRDAASAERRRAPALRGLSRRARLVRERQMCVVATARVSNGLNRLLLSDEDDEVAAVRDDLAAAGLL